MTNESEKVEVRPMQTDVIKADVNVMSAHENALIDSAVATANKFRRTPSESIDNMLAMACRDERIAASCIYTLPKAGLKIKGKSVRLAEICAICWKNLIVGADITGQDDNNVYAVGYARDLENNVSVRITVPRNIRKSTGEIYSRDDIRMTSLAAVSIAYRNAIFRIIPEAIIEKVYARCRQVAVGDSKTFNQRRNEIIDKVKGFGLSEKQVLQFLDCRKIDDIDMDDLATLLGLSNALADNETSIEAVLQSIAGREEPPSDEPVDAKVKKPKKQKEKKPTKQQAKKGKAKQNASESPQTPEPDAEAEQEQESHTGGESEGVQASDKGNSQRRRRSLF